MTAIKSDFHCQLTPDGWILVPEIWPRIVDSKDPSIILALNLCCDRSEVLLYNFDLHSVPVKLMRRCYASIASLYHGRSKEFYHRSLKTIKRAVGKGINSYDRRYVETVVVFGKPLSEYSNLPEHGVNDIWIGINWAFKDTDGFDFCICNSLTKIPVERSRMERPTLIASVLTDQSLLDKWSSMVMYYVPPLLEYVNPDALSNVGNIYDPGDAGVAAIMWANRFKPKKFIFYDADVTRPVASQGSFAVDKGRYAFMGQGLNLAFWSATLYFLKLAGIDFEVASGWRPRHLL